MHAPLTENVATASAVAFNFTVVRPVAPGWLTVWPMGGAVPTVSTLNYVANEVVANAAIVPLSGGGLISAQPAATTDLIIDVNGYFTDTEELGNQNTAVGFNALLNSTGGANTAVGYQALQNNTTGSLNTALGTQALFANTTGSFNTATGRQALVSNTVGSYNTATGVYALLENIADSENTATGFQALLNNTTGGANTATGRNALAGNTTGGANTATLGRPSEQHHGRGKHGQRVWCTGEQFHGP